MTNSSTAFKSYFNILAGIVMKQVLDYILYGFNKA